MALQYKPTKYAFFTEGESLTEQEHAGSCDINRMIKNAKRGMQVRGKETGPWVDGMIDDTTMDAVQFRLKKQQVEDELKEIAKSAEFSEEEIKQMKLSDKDLKKFGFKTRKKVDSQKAEKNNDQTTIQKPNSDSTNTPESKTQS